MQTKCNINIAGGKGSCPFSDCVKCPLVFHQHSQQPSSRPSKRHSGAAVHQRSHSPFPSPHLAKKTTSADIKAEKTQRHYRDPEAENDSQDNFKGNQLAALRQDTAERRATTTSTSRSHLQYASGSAVEPAALLALSTSIASVSVCDSQDEKR